MDRLHFTVYTVKKTLPCMAKEKKVVKTKETFAQSSTLQVLGRR